MSEYQVKLRASRRRVSCVLMRASVQPSCRKLKSRALPAHAVTRCTPRAASTSLRTCARSSRTPPSPWASTTGARYRAHATRCPTAYYRQRAAELLNVMRLCFHRVINVRCDAHSSRSRTAPHTSTRARAGTRWPTPCGTTARLASTEPTLTEACPRSTAATHRRGGASLQG